MNESEYSTMTKDEMQRLVDEEIASGKSYEEALKKLARIIGTFKTIGQPFALDTIFYLAFAAMFRLSHIAV